MEGYAYLFGVPVSDRVPFSGVEGILESRVVAEAIHLKKSDIDSNFTVKGCIKGLTLKFLLEKAFSFSNLRNLVPTLLSDTYFSIHHRTSKGGGTISPIFQENKGCLRWSQRLMYLTNDDITWYSSIYNDIETIDSYEEFSNVPLLGTHEGINYNMTLARCQIGFAMKGNPNNTLLEGFFYQEGKDTQGLKARIVHAWHNVQWKGKGELGLRNYVALEPYTSWVKKREKEFKTPYAYE
ncbi:uncharacterized protein LOC127122446 [Lathyrus oleraceus]|uniref:uncharacterized protein LOC127122446 n=1 Tax=Pisum sativum TaxID=3888 RepID=UPI0021CEF976|nr:uncharacterized protein LOC127122446 [Pisum sativum]